MNIDINDINDLEDVFEDSVIKEENDNIEENKVYKLSDENASNKDNNLNNINKKIYSWKTVIEEFKNSSYSNNATENIPPDNCKFFDITSIDLIPCHEKIIISNYSNIGNCKKEIKMEQPLLPNMKEHFLNNTNASMFFEPHYVNESQ